MIDIKYLKNTISQLEGKTILKVHLKDIYPNIDTFLNKKGYIYSVELLGSPFLYINVFIAGSHQIPKDILRYSGKIAVTFKDIHVETLTLSKGTSHLHWSANKIIIVGGT